MEIGHRTKSLAELKRDNRRQLGAIFWLSLSIAMLIGLLFSQSKIIILATPGMPADSVIQKTSLDKGAQRAVLAAVTNNLAQINPGNAEYQKAFLQAFLAPAVFTKVSSDIDFRVKKMSDERELGSYYFVLKEITYDPAIDKHFVIGDVHTVNAAKDTAAPHVFEYSMHVENYRPVIDSVTTYEGERAHNSEWIEGQKR